MSGNRDEESSCNAGVDTNPAKYQPVTSTSIHGRNTAGNHGGYSYSNTEKSTLGEYIPHESDNSSDRDTWVAPNFSDVNPEQVAIPKVKAGASVFPTAWKDCHVSIKRKADMKILEQCSCKESDIPPVKMQYLLNFHFKELETALCDDLFKLKWTVTCVKPGDQCLSIEVKNYTDESVLEDVILLFSDEVNKVNYCQSMQASKHPELLLKEYIDSGNLAIYVDGEKVFVVGIVENQRKVTETLKKKPTSADYSSTAAYKTDIQFDNPLKCQLLIYLQFLPSLKQKHPSVNVTMNEDRSIMSICGDNHVDVHATVEDVHLFTKDFAVEDITVDPLLIQLLKLQDIKTFIKQLCEEQDLKVIWTLSELNNRITCHCKDKKAVQDFCDVLQHNLEKKTYSKRSFGDKTRIFSTTNMFSNFVKKYDGKCLVSTVEGNSIYIFTTMGISNKLTLLEVNFEDTKTDIQKNLTQNEKKDIHGQASATRKEDTTEEEMEFKTSVVKVPMPHQELQMLKKFDFKTYLSRQIPDIQVTITDDGIELISGTERRLNDEIKAFMSKIGFKRIEFLPLSVLKFYDNCDFVKRKVDAILKKKRIVCHWYVDLNENSLNVFTPGRESLFTVECEIFNTVMYKEYSNTSCAKDVLKCSEVRSVLEKWKNELRLADFDCEKFLVFGLHDAVEEFLKIFEHISERLTQKLPVTKQRLGVSKDLVNYYSKLKSDFWKTFLDIYRVQVEIDQNGEVVIVGSEKKKVQDAISQLQREIGKLTKEKWSCEVFCPRNIQAKLQSDIIPSLENRFQCSVSIESNTNLVYQQQLGQCVNWDKGLHLILVHGHMSEMAADVLVCPINKSLNLSRLGSSMMEKGGSVMKQDLQQKTIVEGQDIYLSSETGNLPCLMVAYLAVPEYKHRVNMQSQVMKCIHELFCSVEKAQLQSLVIPVKLWNDIPETTFLYWFVSALNKNLSQVNVLKQIYLCIEDMHKSDVKLKVLSDGLSTTWHEYNFEHLIENLQMSFPGKRSLRPAEININLVRGKLVDQKVDVIVNSSNPKLELSKGAVSMSILDKGGISILDECKQRYPDGIDFGEAVCTKAGRMNFRFICHSVLPHWTPSAKYSIKILEKLVFDCLIYAQSSQCRSIAFPVFGTGILQYPWDEVAKTMIDTINKYGRMHYDTTIREVKIVLFDKDLKSIQAFETKKKQTEEVKLIPEDPEIPPTFIFESRCRNVRVQIIPLSDTTCHHCEAIVKFVTLGQALKLQKDNPQSNLVTDGIVKSKNENSTFWTVTVISDDDENSYKEAVSKILGFATEERIATLAFCLMQSTGTPLKFKVQATIIKDYIYSALEKNRHLQIAKIIVPSRDKFDLMLKDDKLEEPKGLFSVFSSNRPPWKRVRYSNFVEKPRLLISVLGEKKRQIDELKENLQSTIQKLVKKDQDFMNVTIRHDSEKKKQDTSTKKWVRVLKQKDRMQMFPLSVEVCKQLDDAVKHNHPNVEVMEGVDIFVYKLDEFSYYVNGNDDPAGVFYMEGSSNDQQHRNKGEKRMNQKYRQDSQDSKDQDFMNVTIRHDSEKKKQDTSTKKWVRVLKQKDRMQMFPLSVEVCKQLDDAVKHNHPNVEVMEGVDLFVYSLDDSRYYVNGNDDPAGVFYMEGSSNDQQHRNKGEKRMNQKYRQDSQDSKDQDFMNVTIRHDSEKKKQDTSTKKWVRLQKQKVEYKKTFLSVEVCKQLDDAVKHNHPNVEVMEGVDLFVYSLDDSRYYVNENDDPAGIFYKEGSSNDQQHRNKGEKKMNQTCRQDSQDSKGYGSFNQQTFGEENLKQSTKTDKLGTSVKHWALDDCVICMEPPTLPRKLHCGHVFCDACIVQQLKVNPWCPTCGSVQGVVTGDQPPGTMKVRTSVHSLPGHYNCGRIEIEYVIHPGKQTAEHPNEGQRYEGITRIAYLPDNEKGKKIAKLLKVAFDRKLIFTIGHSRTTGKQGVVTWNDIHHKTTPNPGKQFGYPDDTYFDRVLDELRIKGVTEKDL